MLELNNKMLEKVKIDDMFNFDGVKCDEKNVHYIVS